MIAREGQIPVLASALAGVVVAPFAGLPVVLVILTLFILLVLVFRDPDREIPAAPAAVVSPADGVIDSVSDQYDPYLERQSVRVALQMNPHGVFTTRSPVEGKVLEPANMPEGDSAPHGVWLQTDEADDVVMVMNRGRLHTSPHCYFRYGERIGQGQRCGFIHFGALIELYLPANSRIDVTPGDQVRGGADVIARLVHA